MPWQHLILPAGHWWRRLPLSITFLISWIFKKIYLCTSSIKNPLRMFVLLSTTDWNSYVCPVVRLRLVHHEHRSSSSGLSLQITEVRSLLWKCAKSPSFHRKHVRTAYFCLPGARSGRATGVKLNIAPNTADARTSRRQKQLGRLKIAFFFAVVRFCRRLKFRTHVLVSGEI